MVLTGSKLFAIGMLTFLYGWFLSKTCIRQIYDILILILLQVEWHLKSKCHQTVLEIKHGKLFNERAINTPAGLSQPRIEMFFEDVSTW